MEINLNSGGGGSGGGGGIFRRFWEFLWKFDDSLPAEIRTHNPPITSSAFYQQAIPGHSKIYDLAMFWGSNLICPTDAACTM